VPAKVTPLIKKNKNVFQLQSLLSNICDFTDLAEKNQGLWERNP
jgi:hypothetical protein